jgi:sulfur-oxidizing protein SoxB
MKPALVLAPVLLLGAAASVNPAGAQSSAAEGQKPAFGRPLDAGKSYKVAGWASVNAQRGMPAWGVVARHLRSGRAPDRGGDGVTLRGVDDNPGIAGQG